MATINSASRRWSHRPIDVLAHVIFHAHGFLLNLVNRNLLPSGQEVLKK
jgi:hypothetical protein